LYSPGFYLDRDMPTLELLVAQRLGTLDANDRPALALVLPGGRRIGPADAPVTLRLASLEHHAKANEALPLCLDDVLINSDDDRCRAALAVLVVWLFLRDWRATFVAATALPLSVIPAFIGMHYLGFSLNVVTLLALSLVVGILVDEATVEIENIHRRMKQRGAGTLARIVFQNSITLYQQYFI
jgi:hypothetical protein